MEPKNSSRRILYSLMIVVLFLSLVFSPAVPVAAKGPKTGGGQPTEVAEKKEEKKEQKEEKKEEKAETKAAAKEAKADAKAGTQAAAAGSGTEAAGGTSPVVSGTPVPSGAADKEKGNGKGNKWGVVLPVPPGQTGPYEVCHKPGTPAEKTMYKNWPSYVAHLGHGDKAGKCDGTGPVVTPVTPTVTVTTTVTPTDVPTNTPTDEPGEPNVPVTVNAQEPAYGCLNDTVIGATKVANGHKGVYIIGAGYEQEITKGLKGDSFDGAISPDGCQIAVANIQPGADQADIYIVKFTVAGTPVYFPAKTGAADQRGPSYYDNTHFLFAEKPALKGYTVKDSKDNKDLVKGYNPNAFPGSQTFVFQDGLNGTFSLFDRTTNTSTDLGIKGGTSPKIVAGTELGWITDKGLKLQAFGQQPSQKSFAPAIAAAPVLPGATGFGFDLSGQYAVVIEGGNVVYYEVVNSTFDTEASFALTEDGANSQPWIWSPAEETK